ncbi:PREDICTED: gastrula zinc finger protein XlCGF8.2DB-like [Branchiostoma belcheri]|uniref:Gastrula zinc finger protein XlCGF8.2DB-like n=1 Tax=Branchiostoma belcheri TaxID=7741 RepID=A0A6P4ZWI8_BRABE|nr:PREDICTED: gastrula zinc finger protein XlCGF8.2DB-like [Branchiostoma belcheri]
MRTRKQTKKEQKQTISPVKKSTTKGLRTGTRPRRCPSCSFTSNCKEELLDHVRDLHPSLPILHCSLCEYSTWHKGNMKQHDQMHSQDSVLSCEKCSYTTTRQFAYKMHLKYHHSSERPFKCQTCRKAFAAKSVLRNHLKVHSDDRPFKCPTCEYSARTKGSLVAHISRHKKEKPFLCAECGYRSFLKTEMEKHMRIHTGLHPYKCDQCDYTAVQKICLEVHMTKHTGHLPFICGECGHRSAMKSNLVVHMRTHTGIKPFKCPHCKEYSGASNQSLRRHIAYLHLGVTPVVCMGCSYEPKHKGALRKHHSEGEGHENYRCKVCGKEPVVYRNVLTHLAQHVDVETATVVT